MTIKIIPNVVTDQVISELTATDTIREAADLMSTKRIGAIVITKNSKLIGIITERDLTTRIIAAGLDPNTTKISEAMTPKPDVLGPDDNPITALELMRDRGYRHLPVVKEGAVIGMVSIRDLYEFIRVQLEDDVRQREAFIFDTGYGAS